MKILCIGQAAYDITLPISEYPTENLKYKIHERVECGGGSASNAAYLLGKWGADIYFAGIVGNDVYGKKIRDEFRTIGVNIDYLQFSNEFDTPASYIIVNKENGSRTILTYRATSMKMNDVSIGINPDIILIDGREYEMSKKVIKENPNAIVIIDAGNNRSEVKDLCLMSDYVVCSKVFAEDVSGMKITDLTNLNTIMEKLEEQFSTNIIITLESDGSCYRDSNNLVRIIPSIKVKAIDTTGAGDIFHGAFTYGISNSWPIEKTLKFANVAGAMSVTKVGGRNSVFSLKELEEVYNEIK